MQVLILRRSGTWDALLSSACVHIIISGSEGPRRQRGQREGWAGKDGRNARKKARSDLRAPLSEFTVEDRGSYGVQLCAHVQHRGSHRKIFSSGFPPRPAIRPSRGRFFMSFYSPFPLRLLHPRAIYEPGERHAPARFIPWPVEWARHRFTYGISRLPRFDSDPPRIRDTYDASILPRKHDLRRENWPILR